MLGFGRVQSLGLLDGKEAFLVLSPGTGLCSMATARFSSCSFGAHPMLKALSLCVWGWMGSTPGCWFLDPAGDLREVGRNSWSRTQSYVKPSISLWLSCTYSAPEPALP